MSATCSTVKAELGVAAEGAFVGVDMAHALKRWICKWHAAKDSASKLVKGLEGGQQACATQVLRSEGRRRRRGLRGRSVGQNQVRGCCVYWVGVSHVKKMAFAPCNR